MRDPDHPPLKSPAKLKIIRFLTSLTLWVERLTLHGWRILSWVLTFCGLWLLRIPDMLGYAAQIGASILFMTGALFFLMRDLMRLRPPSRHEINRRIEQASQLKHQPLTMLEDHLANPHEGRTESLWQRGRESAKAALMRLKPAGPKPFMVRLDPYALRLGAVLFFGIGALIAGPLWQDRILSGIMPIQITPGADSGSGALITITPPEYTKILPIVLQGSMGKTQADPLKIPEGSTMKIRISGGLGTPSLKVGEQRWPLEKAGDGNYFLETPVPNGSALDVEQLFFTRSYWPYEIVIDQPPKISGKEDPEILPDGAIRFPLSVFDDYGVQVLSVRMALDNVVEQPPIGQEATEDRAVISPANTDFAIQPVYDMTHHTWSGLPVVFHFSVKDFKGQIAELEPVRLVLPEREFTHPIAKKLIEMRKQLSWAPLDDYMMLSKNITGLMIQPDAYQHDPIVFLSLRSAASRLLWSPPSHDTAAALIAQLWDTALHVEEGHLELASRNLRSAQSALEKTLRNPDASEAEITAAMNDLREAMAEYFMELQREMQKRMESGEQMPMFPPEMMAQNINPEDLANFLDELEQKMLSGDQQSAEEMLAQLQRLMDMMQPSMSAQMPPDMQMMSEGINELQELIDRQKDLLGQTEKQVTIIKNYEGFTRDFGAFEEPEPSIMQKWNLDDLPPPPAMKDDLPALPMINTQHNKAEQEALRFILGQLMLDAAEVMDDIPETMGLAEQEMRQSSDFLGKNVPEGSMPHQQQAIDYLEQAQKDLSQQLQARMKQMTGFAMGSGGMQYDPLGRPYGGKDGGNSLLPGSQVKIPNESEQKRAQEILKLLRRRSGELDRPQYELDYFQRLLRQF